MTSAGLDLLSPLGSSVPVLVVEPPWLVVPPPGLGSWVPAAGFTERVAASSAAPFS